jgi:hypothetical protein
MTSCYKAATLHGAVESMWGRRRTFALSGGLRDLAGDPEALEGMAYEELRANCKSKEDSALLRQAGNAPLQVITGGGGRVGGQGKREGGAGGPGKSRRRPSIHVEG